MIRRNNNAQSQRFGFAQTPVQIGRGFGSGPNQAANINHYKIHGTRGPHGPSVPVQLGSAHSGVGGLGYSANLARHINQNLNRDYNRGDRLASLRNRSRQRPQRPGIQPDQSRSGSASAPVASGGVYSPEVMQRMRNREVDRAFTAADSRQAQKPFMGRGLSLDAGTMAGATPSIARALSNAAYASRVQPLFDYLQNQQHNIGQRYLDLNKLSALQGITR